jgi:hypothetical protein
MAPFLRDRRHVGTVQASAIDKSAIVANDLREPRDSSGGLFSERPGTDVPLEFTVKSEYACSWI